MPPYKAVFALKLREKSRRSPGRPTTPLPSRFAVPLPALIAARGAESPVVRMRPLRCAACGGRETELRITVPSRVGA